jgi:hypothetical protein
MGRDRCGIEDRERRQASWKASGDHDLLMMFPFFFSVSHASFYPENGWIEWIDGISCINWERLKRDTQRQADLQQKEALSLRVIRSTSLKRGRRRGSMRVAPHDDRSDMMSDAFPCEREQKTNAGAIILISCAVVSLFSLSS